MAILPGIDSSHWFSFSDWYSDPTEEMVTILMTQHAWTSPDPPDICLDFWTSAYQAIDD